MDLTHWLRMLHFKSESHQSFQLEQDTRAHLARTRKNIDSHEMELLALLEEYSIVK
jgi:hypothetical protein